MKGEESEIWLLQRTAKRGPPTSRDRGPCLSMAIWRTERTHKALPACTVQVGLGQVCHLLSTYLCTSYLTNITLNITQQLVKIPKL